MPNRKCVNLHSQYHPSNSIMASEQNTDQTTSSPNPTLHEEASERVDAGVLAMHETITAQGGDFSLQSEEELRAVLRAGLAAAIPTATPEELDAMISETVAEVGMFTQEDADTFAADVALTTEVGVDAILARAAPEEDPQQGDEENNHESTTD